MNKQIKYYTFAFIVLLAFAVLSASQSGYRNSALAESSPTEILDSFDLEPPPEINNAADIQATSEIDRLLDSPPDEEFQVQAVLTSNTTAVISGAMDGVLKNIPLNSGDSFKKGDILVEYECRFEKAKQREAHAELKAVSRQVEAYERLKKTDSVADVEYVSILQEYEKIKAIYDQTKARLELCTIKAPFDGRVTDKIANNYEAVKAGRVLMEIGSKEPLRADLLIPSIWLRWLNIGTDLEITVYETGKTYEAKIKRIHGKVDPVTQTAYVVAEINKYEEELLPGMSGQARFSKTSQWESPGFLGIKIKANE